MTNPTHDPDPINRPSIENLYVGLLCEVHEMLMAQHKCWERPTTNNKAERLFRENLVWSIVSEELKTLAVTINTATLFIPEAEIPY